MVRGFIFVISVSVYELGLFSPVVWELGLGNCAIVSIDEAGTVCFWDFSKGTLISAFDMPLRLDGQSWVAAASCICQG